MTDRPWSGRLFTWLRKGLSGMPAALRLNEGLGVTARLHRALHVVHLLDRRHVTLKDGGNLGPAKRTAIVSVLVLQYSYAVLCKTLYASQMPRLRALHDWLVQVGKGSTTSIGKFIVFRLSLKVFELHNFVFQRAYFFGERVVHQHASCGT